MLGHSPFISGCFPFHFLLSVYLIKVIRSLVSWFELNSLQKIISIITFDLKAKIHLKLRYFCFFLIERKVIVILPICIMVGSGGGSGGLYSPSWTEVHFIRAIFSEGTIVIVEISKKMLS